MYKPEELQDIQERLLDYLFDGVSLKRSIEKLREYEVTQTEKTERGGKIKITQKPYEKLNRSTVYEWLNPKSPYYSSEFSDNYARTREDQGDYNADVVEDLAQDVVEGKLDPQAGRVAIDANKWAAGVKKPKKYGNKQYVEQKSQVTVSRQYYDLSCLTDEELDQYEALVVKIMRHNGEDPDEDPKQ